jgi:hypothetical protein
VSETPGHDDARGDDARGDDRDDELWPEQTSDDTDRGWGEHPDEVDDDERIRREKPPHW